MPMAVSSAAHPDRVKSIVRKIVKDISTAATLGRMSIVESFDRACDAIDKKDEQMNDGGMIITGIHFNVYPLVMIFPFP